jgi:succinoglycan biosynthesis protein ExoM
MRNRGATVKQTVVILICTFNRPHYLSQLLRALAREVSSADCLTLSVVIIDNGTQDVRDIVEIHRSEMPIEYERLPGAGLVGARNRSLKCALRHAPDFLVFIDDDEVPELGWLNELIFTLNASGVDFAVGPVEPQFETPPPSWAPEFFRKTGDAFCTSNLIVRASIVPKEQEHWFQPKFTYTGGEDGEFLKRLEASGARHTVSRSALVRESIPPQRVSALYIWRRGFRDGVVYELLRKESQAAVASNWNTRLLALRKAGYGINHLFWSIFQFGRFYRAIDDFSMALGLILSSSSSSYKFYR